tara:strand:+ start:5518 stop:5901 length:384 start_codon:yes stop_codon:yes gene_type:complete
MIPKSGRNIQCGSCNHIWFYEKKGNISPPKLEIDNQYVMGKIENQENYKAVEKTKIKKNIKSNTKTFNFNKILSYLIVGIISFVAIIIILDTFKSPLKNFFPNLEFFLLNLNESLKDIFLFFENLLQ